MGEELLNIKMCNNGGFRSAIVKKYNMRIPAEEEWQDAEGVGQGSFGRGGGRPLTR